jgi:hypothetical protein
MEVLRTVSIAKGQAENNQEAVGTSDLSGLTGQLAQSIRWMTEVFLS